MGVKTPFLSRAVFAPGLFCLLFVLLVSASKASPAVKISETKFNVGSVTSGSGTRSSGHVFFAGGHHGTTKGVTNVVKKLDLLTGTVSTVAPLPTARAGLGLVEAIVDQPVANNFLYAIGGVNGSGTVLNTVEVYNFSTGTWSAAAPMPTARAYLSVVAGTDGYIYAIGGVNQSGASLATVEAYNQVKNTWITISSLNTARSHCGAVLLPPNNYLFVTGGVSGKGKYLDSTEVYSLATGGSWGVVGSLNVPRSDFGLAIAADGNVHAFGGNSASGELTSIEGYSPSTGVWKIEANPLPAPQALLAAAEGLDGSDYLLGGANGSTVYSIVKKASTPLEPLHSVDFYLHDVDEPFINGARSMDADIPLTLNPLIVSLLGGATWASLPAVTGTIEASATAQVIIPNTLGVSVLTTFTLSTTDLDGGSSQVLGSTTVLIGLGLGGTTVNIPITTPVKLTNKVLTLTISTLVAVDVNLTTNKIYLEIAGLNGKP
jgi:Kelch motif/Galactose oxidase, central domain